MVLVASRNLKPNLNFEKEAWKKKYDLVIGVDEVGRGSLAGPVVAGAVAIVIGTGSVISSRARLLWPRRGGAAYPCAAKNHPRHCPLEEFNWFEIGINDSKKLTVKKREELDKIIRRNAAWGIGEVGVAFINRWGIVKATEKAMRSAIANLVSSNRNKMQDIGNMIQALASKPESWIWNPESRPKIFVLVDAFHVKYIPGVGLKNQKAVIKGDQKVFSIAAASIIAKVHRDVFMTRTYRNNRTYRIYRWDRNKGYGTRDHLWAIKKYGITRLHRLAFVKKFV